MNHTEIESLKARLAFWQDIAVRACFQLNEIGAMREEDFDGLTDDDRKVLQDFALSLDSDRAAREKMAQYAAPIGFRLCFEIDYSQDE